MSTISVMPTLILGPGDNYRLTLELGTEARASQVENIPLLFKDIDEKNDFDLQGTSITLDLNDFDDDSRRLLFLLYGETRKAGPIAFYGEGRSPACLPIDEAAACIIARSAKALKVKVMCENGGRLACMSTEHYTRSERHGFPSIRRREEFSGPYVEPSAAFHMLRSNGEWVFLSQGDIWSTSPGDMVFGHLLKKLSGPMRGRIRLDSKADAAISRLIRQNCESGIPPFGSVRLTVDVGADDSIICMAGVVPYGEKEPRFALKNTAYAQQPPGNTIDEELRAAFSNSDESSGYYRLAEPERYEELVFEKLPEWDARPELEVHYTHELEKLFMVKPSSLGITMRAAFNGGLTQLSVDPGQLGDKRQLSDLLNAITAGRKSFRLGNRLLDLRRSEDCDSLVEMAEALEAAGVGVDGGTLPPWQALALKGLLPEGAADDSLEEFANRICMAARENWELPQLELELRPYQKDAFRWMQTLHTTKMGGILADEMGLGKTAECIALFAANAEQLKQKPALVVAPAKVCGNWVSEIAKFAPQLTARTLSSKDLDITKAQVNVLSYEMFRDRHEALANTKDEGPVFSTVIYDEAQKIKTATSKVARAAHAMRARTESAFCVTGTPIDNRPLELYSLMQACLPGYLGSAEEFRNLERHIIAGNEERIAELKAKIAPFYLRRLKEGNLELPELVETVIECPLKPGTQQLQHAAWVTKLNMDLTSLKNSNVRADQFKVLGDLTRIRQAVLDPRLLDADCEEHGTKSGECVRIVKEMSGQGRKTLLFSTFTTYLDLLAADFDQAGIRFCMLTGKDTAKSAQRAIDEFKSNDNIDVFLISLKAGGTGLNLTEASCVIITDPWYCVSPQLQAIMRAHRPGQSTNVQVFLLAGPADSIEGKIVALQQAKKNVADSLITENETQVLASLNGDELIAFLSDGVEEEPPSALRGRQLPAKRDEDFEGL